MNMTLQAVSTLSGVRFGFKINIQEVSSQLDEFIETIRKNHLDSDSKIKHQKELLNRYQVDCDEAVFEAKHENGFK
jgi:hypothetical protein